MIREPAVAGIFYSSSPAKLRKEVFEMLDDARIDEQFEKVHGIVAPHAGYIYSGRTAAYAYNAVANKNFKTAVVISPSHREYFPGISVYEGEGYKTPLGVLYVDAEKAERLTADKSYIFKGMNGHRSEHALEVQLPFLQTVYPEIKIVPVVMGDQRKELIDFLAQKLSDIADDETIIIASSDLSHFHSKSKAVSLDSRVAQRISDFDFEGLCEDLESKKSEACGGGPIAAMMKAGLLRNFTYAKVLARSDSGDVTGDSSEVVGYLSAIVYS